MLKARAPTFLRQAIRFLSIRLALCQLAIANSVNSLVNVSSDDLELLPLNGPSVANVHATDLIPLILAKVGGLRGLAIWAQRFENTGAAALTLLSLFITLLGDVSIGPEPESTMYLCSVSRSDYGTNEGAHRGRAEGKRSKGKVIVGNVTRHFDRALEIDPTLRHCEDDQWATIAASTLNLHSVLAYGYM